MQLAMTKKALIAGASPLPESNLPKRSRAELYKFKLEFVKLCSL